VLLAKLDYFIFVPLLTSFHIVFACFLPYFVFACLYVYVLSLHLPVLLYISIHPPSICLPV
jgi:hypothetical protein